jgi:hypothetical protein
MNLQVMDLQAIKPSLVKLPLCPQQSHDGSRMRLPWNRDFFPVNCRGYKDVGI